MLDGLRMSYYKVKDLLSCYAPAMIRSSDAPSLPLYQLGVEAWKQPACGYFKAHKDPSSPPPSSGAAAHP